MTAPVAPLDGLLVVDLSDGIAGAYATKMLVDGGATVVRVEPPRGTSLRRRVAAAHRLAPGEDAALFHYLDAGKQSTICDLDDPTSCERRDTLLALAAVVVVDDACAVDERDGRALHDAFPDAVVVSVTPFGLTGPWAGRPATEFTLQAWGGSIAGRGSIDQPPVAAGGELAWWISGAAAAAAALAAWRGGAGVLIDLAGIETVVSIYNGFQTVAHELTGVPSPVPSRVTEVPSIEPAIDGWVGFCALSAPQFTSFADMIGRPEWATDPDISRIDHRTRNARTLRPVVAEWTTARTVQQILDEAMARRVPCAPVGNGETLPHIEQLRARDTFVRNPSGGFLQPRPPARLSRTPSEPLRTAPALGRGHAGSPLLPASRRAAARTWPFPLRGIRVFDLTSFWAGPVVSQMLAAFGAEVIKVESVQRPDGTRLGTSYGVQGDRLWERAPLFHGCNTGKAGITLDLTRPEGRALARRLVARCDVVIENYTPRVLETFELLDAERDDLIVVRMPAWGLEGPWRNQPGFAQTMEQVTGLGWVTGHVDGPPLVPRGPCDPNGGYHAFVATMLAILERDRSGRGQFVESALVDAALNVAAQQVIEHDAYGERLDRLGNRSRDHAPQGVYAAAGDEHWVALSVATDAHWHAFTTVVDRPDWAADPALATLAGRRAAHDRLDEGIATWCASLERGEIVDALWRAGVPAAEVVAPRDVGANPHLLARGYFEPVDHDVVGHVRLPRFPAVLTPRPAPWHLAPAPTLGRDTRQLLHAVLGLGDAELDALEAGAITGTAPVAQDATAPAGLRATAARARTAPRP